MLNYLKALQNKLPKLPNLCLYTLAAVNSNTIILHKIPNNIIFALFTKSTERHS